jgi:TPR repeat protein
MLSSLSNLLQSSSQSVRTVKEVVKKFEKIPEKKKRRNHRSKNKKQLASKLNLHDDVSVSDFSTDSSTQSSDDSRFAFSVGVQSIKDEIEERIRRSRKTSNDIIPSTYTKTKVIKSETINGVYDNNNNNNNKNKSQPNNIKSGSSVFGDESPLFDENGQRLIVLECVDPQKQKELLLQQQEELENRTVATKTSVARSLFTQKAENMTVMYQPESVFGEESPLFIGEPTQEEEDEESPNTTDRTDKPEDDEELTEDEEEEMDECRTKMSTITMNEQQFLPTYKQPEQSKSKLNSPESCCPTEEISRVTTETFGTAVLQLLQNAIVNPNNSTPPTSSTSSITTASATSSASKNSELLKEDEEDKDRLRNFLREVGCTQSKANHYATILVGNGVPNIEVLTRRIARDNYYLEKIGFDNFFARDIVELLTPDTPPSSSSAQQQTQQQQSSSTSSSSSSAFPSMNSMPSMSKMQSFLGNEQSFFMTPSVRSSNYGGSGGGVDDLSCIKSVSFHDDGTEPSFMRESQFNASSSQFQMDHLPSETSSIYYQAVQIGSIESADKLIELAETGDLFARGYIMRMKALGQQPFTKDVEKAQEIAKLIFPQLKEAVRSKLEDYSGYSSYFVGVCYSEGLVGEKNPKEAIKWYKQSAKQGYEAAQAYLGFALYSGLGIVKNRVEAVKWYTMSASQGYAPAQTNLGICYELGEGVQKNIAEAIKWYKLAAEQNDSTAMYNLGHCYETGLGVTLDIVKAAEFYTTAAELNHATAQYSLGYLYSIGYPQFPQNLTEAVRLFKSSADQGNHEAQCKLGLMYENGLGVGIDTTEAVKYYRLSANQGNMSALYYLGFCYFNGIGLEKDQAIAVKLYFKSAQKGYAAAQNNLGFCYFVGAGVKKSYLDALRWYKKSAEQGYPAGQYNLGYCYEKGYGVPIKLHEMLKWYRVAAKSGHPKAVMKLNEWKEK